MILVAKCLRSRRQGLDGNQVAATGKPVWFIAGSLASQRTRLVTEKGILSQGARKSPENLSVLYVERAGQLHETRRCSDESHDPFWYVSGGCLGHVDRFEVDEFGQLPLKDSSRTGLWQCCLPFHDPLEGVVIKFRLLQLLSFFRLLLLYTDSL